MTAPQSTARGIDQTLPELPEAFGTIRTWHDVDQDGYTADQMRAYATQHATEAISRQAEELADLKYGDEILRQISGTLRAQSEFTGNYAEIVVQILAKLAAERAEVVRLREALEEIALAGMSPSPEMSQDGVEAWHAQRAWEFISIAARAISPAALATPNQGDQS